MPIDIVMPAFAPTMEKGNLIQWLKAVGDPVRSGEVLAEIETDKATMEVEASADGVLSRILVPAGTQDVAVSQVIGLMTTEDEASPRRSDSLPEKTPTAIVSSAAATKTAAAASDGVSPLAKTTPRPNGDGIGRIFASPIARRLMSEAGLNATSLVGTGPRGRILERDVSAALAARATDAKAKEELAVQMPTAAPAAAPSAPEMVHDSKLRALFGAGSFVEVPHDPMRLTIARRLSESKRTIPHFYLSADCAIDSLLSLRQQFNDAAPSGRDGERAYRLSVNDFVIRALALALNQVPDANVSFSETSLLRHRHADIGVAVAIAGGLMTPIVRHAETKSIATISNEIKELAARAKTRRLKPEEYQGGTASVSNLGMYGVRDFAAIVNPPQASILAVGAGEQRMVVTDCKPTVATVMTVTLSVDHRAIDGASAAELLSAFKTLIEKPITMLA
jgi:pyruvate dehydrogenase E2 component (dihydrolipoamide acetyltransferase)